MLVKKLRTSNNKRSLRIKFVFEYYLTDILSASHFILPFFDQTKLFCKCYFSPWFVSFAKKNEFFLLILLFFRCNFFAGDTREKSLLFASGQNAVGNFHGRMNLHVTSDLTKALSLTVVPCARRSSLAPITCQNMSRYTGRWRVVVWSRALNGFFILPCFCVFSSSKNKNKSGRSRTSSVPASSASHVTTVLPGHAVLVATLPLNNSTQIFLPSNSQALLGDSSQSR